MKSLTALTFITLDGVMQAPGSPDEDRSGNFNYGGWTVPYFKEKDGPRLQIHGSSNLMQTLFRADIVDELWLKIFPITIGTGKKLFAQGTVPANFKMTESKTSPLGVIIANYSRAGDIKNGSFTRSD